MTVASGVALNSDGDPIYVPQPVAVTIDPCAGPVPPKLWVTLCLTDEVDCSRGDVISIADNPPQVANQFEATIVWMADEPMRPGARRVGRKPTARRWRCSI